MMGAYKYAHQVKSKSPCYLNNHFESVFILMMMQGVQPQRQAIICASKKTDNG